MILKGKNPCILTLSGGDRTTIDIEWLREKSEETLYVFCSPDEYTKVNEREIPLNPEKIAAAAFGENFATKGQFGRFHWQRAQEKIRIDQWSQKETPQLNFPETEVQTKESLTEKNQPPGGSKLTLRSEETESISTTRCGGCVRGKQLSSAPFPEKFPNSVWYRFDYASPGGGWHYLTGTIYQEGKPTYTATAVPGKYSMKPPTWLKEFSLFLQSTQHRQGYWIALSPYQI